MHTTISCFTVYHLTIVSQLDQFCLAYWSSITLCVENDFTCLFFQALQYTGFLGESHISDYVVFR